MSESAGERSKEEALEGELASDEVQYDRVSRKLDEFEIISGSFLRQLFSILPFLIGLLLLVDWLFTPLMERPGGSSKFIVDDLPRLSTFLIVIIELLVMRSLFAKLPEVLRAVWRMGLEELSGTPASSADLFVGFLERFEASLNHRLAWLVGIGTATLSLLALEPVQNLLSGGGFSAILSKLRYPFFAFSFLVFPPLGYVLGLFVWRTGAIPVYITRLGRQFRFKILPNHPDRSGGLKPLGDLCLTLAYSFLFLALFLSFWGFIITLLDVEGADYFASLWRGFSQKSLVVLILASYILFLQPLYQIHIQMKERRTEIQSELGNLERKMEAISRELRQKADELDIDQGEELISRLEIMEKAYKTGSDIPVWPFDWRVFRKFIAAQSIPILSLVGTSGPIIKIVEILTSLIRE